MGAALRRPAFACAPALLLDPSLAAALLGATPERLLGDMQTLGMLFENLVLRDVRVFLQMRRALRSI